MVTVERVNEISSVAQVQLLWNELVSKTDSDTVFLTYEWVLSWWQAFGDEHELYLLFVKKRNEVIGIAPLMLTPLQGRKKKIQFIGTPNSDYNDFIGEDKKTVIEKVIYYLFQNKNDWSEIELSQIPEKSHTPSILRDTLKKAGKYFRETEIETVMSSHYEGDEAGRDVFQLKRGRSFKRYQNYFKKHKGLTLERLQYPAAVISQLPLFFQCHVTRWHSLANQSKFLKSQTRTFHERLAENLGPLKRVSFMLLKHGETPLAYLFAYDYKKTINLYNITNESFHQKRSQGIILLHLLTELFIRRGYDTIDFGRGVGAHKMRFINHSSKNSLFVIYKNKYNLSVVQLLTKMRRSFPVKSILADERVKKLRKRLTTFRQGYQRSGTGFQIKRAVQRLLFPFFQYSHFMIFTNNVGQYYQRDVPKGFEVKKLGEEEIEEICNFYGVIEGSRKHEVIVERFKKKCDCYAIMQHSRIVTIAWGLYDGNYDKEIGLKLELEKNQVCFSDTQSAELYREMNLEPILKAYMLKEYEKKGVSILEVVNTANKSALQAVAKQNYKYLYSRRIVKLIGRSVLFF